MVEEETTRGSAEENPSRPSDPAQGEQKAKRGGGPRTAAGKERVRRNPIKHGVLAQTPVIPLVEQEGDWLRLRERIFAYLEVEGGMEEALADRIAGIVWRLHRVVRYETEAISRQLAEVPRDWRAARRVSKRPVGEAPTAADVAEMDAMIMARLLPAEETMDKVMRYETKFHRFLLQTLHQLMLLKGLRRSSYGHGREHGMSDLNPTGLAGRAGRQPLPARALERRASVGELAAGITEIGEADG